MLRRFIAVLGVVLVCCVAATPALGAIVIGGPVNQPGPIVTVSADPRMDVRFFFSGPNLQH